MKPDPAAGQARLTVTTVVLLSLGPLAWAGNTVIARAVHAELSPFALAFWRMAIGGLVLAPFAAQDVWRGRMLLRSQWRLLLILAATGIVLNPLFIYAAMGRTTATHGGLVLGVRDKFVTFRPPGRGFPSSHRSGC